jgi:P-type conjugative transfer protein TrbJ
MIRKRLILVVMLLVLVLTMGPGTAQIQVFDPANYAQNLQTAANTLKQINNQLTALQNQTQMLLNQAKHLVSLPTSLVSAIDQTFTQTQNILRNVDRITYDVQAIGQAFASYQHFNASRSDQQLIALAQGRWQTSIDAFQHSLSVGATTVNNLSATQTQTGTLVSASQSAVGQLQATQAGNQLLGVQSRQLSDLTALVAAESRAAALELARQAAAEDQAREQTSRFLNNGQSYQPQTAQMFH